ncbi:hypothetical protein V8C34DRAFT_270045 [Trichoderma compactum]
MPSPLPTLNYPLLLTLQILFVNAKGNLDQHLKPFSLLRLISSYLFPVDGSLPLSRSPSFPGSNFNGHDKRRHGNPSSNNGFVKTIRLRASCATWHNQGLMDNQYLVAGKFDGKLV